MTPFCIGISKALDAVRFKNPSVDVIAYADDIQVFLIGELNVINSFVDYHQSGKFWEFSCGKPGADRGLSGVEL